MIIFETERLIVRHYEENDQDNFFLINGDEDVMRYIRPVKTKEETDRFFEETLTGYKEKPNVGRWAVNEKISGNFIGSFAIISIPQKTELIQLGYALLKDHWGKGFATELTVAGLRHVFDVMKLEEIYGLTESRNLNSQKVLLKAGFKKESEKQDNEKIIYWFLCKKEDQLLSY